MLIILKGFTLHYITRKGVLCAAYMSRTGQVLQTSTIYK